MHQSKKLSKLSGVSHGFFNNKYGVSKGIYKSLNCGPGSRDQKINILKNLKIAKLKISKKSKEVFLVKQTHSNKFVYMSKNLKVKNREHNTNVLNHIPINRSLSISGKPYCNNDTITTVL